MSDIELSKLTSGEPAYAIGKVAYALFPWRDGFAIREKYNPMERPAETFSDKDFNTQNVKLISSQDEFVAFLSSMKRHHEQKLAFGRKDESCSTSTPWGTADSVTRYVRGLNCYGTPSHGGFKVATRLNAIVPDSLRNDDGWYEHHCEWAKIAWAMPQFFTDRENEHARELVINWYPDAFESLTGTILEEGQSFKKDERLFHERNVDNWVVISAINSSEHAGMVHVTATLGGERKRWNGPDVDERDFLVPSEDYQTKSVHGFVIDLTKHEEIQPSAALKR